VLTKWILNYANALPAYCSTHLGVGGMVVNKSGQVLVITEKKGPAAVEGFWKFPGGAVDPMEDITVACEREVFEETGIKVKFAKILALRHMLEFRFQRGDLYCLCLCLLEDENQVIEIQETEISACKWMSLEEFLQLKHVKESFQHIDKVIRAAAAEALHSTGQVASNGFVQEAVPNRFTGKKDLWYFSKL
jgi:ADP-ribose pyrophosphatase YjhB (NUDIX family)